MFTISFSDVSVDFIISIVVVIIGIISFFLYKDIRRKHLNDPEYQKKKERMEEERREKMRLEKENDELNSLMMSNADDYKDE